MRFKDQKEMFLFIWETRPHVSEISGKPLVYPSQSFHVWQFAHVLGKGAYPRYKLNPDNIMLMTKDEHEKQESFKAFRDRRDELKTRYYKELT
tara:strand:+ start:92 stop:370 length:279 start_codon:yes stop_codon:yes gene_type:complete